MDLYEILGVDKKADKAAIKKAYRKKATKLHPDKNKNENPEAFHALQRAYETLVDEEKRAHYDETGDYDTGNGPTRRETIMAKLTNLFIKLTESHGYADRDYFRDMRVALSEELSHINAHLKHAKDRRKKLAKFLTQMKASSDFKAGLEQDLAAMDSFITHNEDIYRMANEALEIVTEFEWLGKTQNQSDFFSDRSPWIVTGSCG